MTEQTRIHMTRTRKKRKLRPQPPRKGKKKAKARFQMPQAASVSREARARQVRNSVRTLQSGLGVVRRLLTASRLYTFILLLLCLYAIISIARNDIFYINDIAVSGAFVRTPEEIVETSQLGGRHIFAVDPNTAAEAVQALPNIKSARVISQWPDQTLIEVEEDKPMLAWQENGYSFWVNQSGELVATGANQLQLLTIQAVLPSPPVPEAQAEDESEVEEGEEGEKTEEVVDARNTFFAFVPEDIIDGALQLQGLRPNIETLGYDLNRGLSYIDGRGWTAHFGSGTDMATKLPIYEAIVDYLLENGVTPTYISVSNPEKPYYGAVGLDEALIESDGQ